MLFNISGMVIVTPSSVLINFDIFINQVSVESACLLLVTHNVLDNIFVDDTKFRIQKL